MCHEGTVAPPSHVPLKPAPFLPPIFERRAVYSKSSGGPSKRHESINIMAAIFIASTRICNDIVLTHAQSYQLVAAMDHRCKARNRYTNRQTDRPKDLNIQPAAARVTTHSSNKTSYNVNGVNNDFFPVDWSLDGTCNQCNDRQVHNRRQASLNVNQCPDLLRQIVISRRFVWVSSLRFKSQRSTFININITTSVYSLALLRLQDL